MKKLPSDRGEAASALMVEAKSHAKILGGFVGLLWLIQIVNSLIFNGALTDLGIQPRSFEGLRGILFAPFIHGSFTHLIANTLPLAVLGWFVMLRQKRDLLTVSLFAALVGGLGVWLIAPAQTSTIGASGLVFGYLGYLLFRGIFERRFWPILGSVVTFFAFGGLLYGVAPGTAGVSWQCHLFGLLGGIIAARWLTAKPAAQEAKRMPVGRRIPEIEAPRVRLPAEPSDDDDTEEELARMKARLPR
ncbi:MAG: rhomboid family intramembrane serine protease [Byssovorax sp.]